MVMMPSYYYDYGNAACFIHRIKQAFPSIKTSAATLRRHLAEGETATVASDNAAGWHMERMRSGMTFAIDPEHTEKQHVVMAGNGAACRVARLCLDRKRLSESVRGEKKSLMNG